MEKPSGWEGDSEANKSLKFGMIHGMKGAIKMLWQERKAGICSWKVLSNKEGKGIPRDKKYSRDVQTVRRAGRA